MGFPHCPICVFLAFIYVYMGVARSYMFFILFKEFIKEESKFNFKFGFA